MKLLRDIRRELGITQDEMARRVGVSSVTLKHWEQGHTTPTMAYLRAIERAYECDVHEIADFAEASHDGRRRASVESIAAQREAMKRKTEEAKLAKAMKRADKARKALEEAERAREEAARKLAVAEAEAAVTD